MERTRRRHLRELLSRGLAAFPDAYRLAGAALDGELSPSAFAAELRQRVPEAWAQLDDGGLHAFLGPRWVVPAADRVGLPDEWGSAHQQLLDAARDDAREAFERALPERLDAVARTLPDAIAGLPGADEALSAALDAVPELAGQVAELVVAAPRVDALAARWAAEGPPRSVPPPAPAPAPVEDPKRRQLRSLADGVAELLARLVPAGDPRGDGVRARMASLLAETERLLAAPTLDDAELDVRIALNELMRDVQGLNLARRQERAPVLAVRMRTTVLHVEPVAGGFLAVDADGAAVKVTGKGLGARDAKAPPGPHGLRRHEEALRALPSPGAVFAAVRLGDGRLVAGGGEGTGWLALGDPERRAWELTSDEEFPPILSLAWSGAQVLAGTVSGDLLRFDRDTLEPQGAFTMPERQPVSAVAFLQGKLAAGLVNGEIWLVDPADLA